ncbi:MAG: sortase [Acidimicrobiales bacterium]|nr:sortase [Acidimicrobiales bacterium]
MFARILGGIGKAMIAAGVLILLFVAYQLWGTGFQTAQAQEALKKEFEARLAEVTARNDGQVSTTARDGEQAPSAPEGPPAPSGTSASRSSLPGEDGGQSRQHDNANGGGTAAKGATVTVEPPRTADTRPLARQWGDPIGQIQIPKIGADFYMIEGVDLSLLKEGPGHFPETPFPGQPGNAALAGHRTTYLAPFNRIDELEPGDLITIRTEQGRFTYEVMAQPTGLGHYIVGPEALEILEDKGDNRLTLMACHPKYSAAERIVVEAKLIGNPAEPTPRSKSNRPVSELPGEELGQGATGSGDALLAAGDPEARLPAVLWSLAALAVWFAAWLIGRIWRKVRWPAYLVGVAPFAILLYHAFENINRALPGAY